MLPIVPHFHPDPESKEVERAVRLADDISRERELLLEPEFLPLVPDRVRPGGTLHVDDLAAIAFLDRGRDCRFYQERARLRAEDGDLVATSLPVADGYEDYCRDFLGLGSVEWLHPVSTHLPGRIAEACWEDHAVRQLLVDRIRRGDLVYVHPHMGTFAVWEVAALLSDAAGSPLKVIAPPPCVSDWLNDKIAFAALVARLFGEEFIPRTMAASNFAVLARHVAALADSGATIGIKLPDSAGGEGTLVVDAEIFADQPLARVRDKLKELLAELQWAGERELLIDVWESDALSSPSVQLWIPPSAEGPPVVEAVFSQLCEGRTGVFVGSQPAALPQPIMRDVVNRCWLITHICQRLGYIGRCSFDLLLVGPEFESSRVKFIECNGRWGGASAPMTLMNRLLGDWTQRPYVGRVSELAGLDRHTFKAVAQWVRKDLYDARSGRGRLILTTPGRITARSAIDVIALGETVTASARALDECFLAPVRRELSKR